MSRHYYLSGPEEDASILAAVVADAQATQSIHREMLQRMADWEAREPGRINSDDGLRNAFIENLDGLRSAFTDRALRVVDVAFPWMLDRANPAHAVVSAVRDDIGETRDLLDQRQAQIALGKQIKEIQQGLLERSVQSATSAIERAAAKLPEVIEKTGNVAKYIAWGIGGIAVIYALNLFSSSRGRGS